MTYRRVMIYEVSNSYVTNGNTTSIQNIGTMTIHDSGDSLLNATPGADPGSNQVISTSFGDASTYKFYYNDTSNIGGSLQSIKTFQLTIDGTVRTYIMNDSLGSIPGAAPGSSVKLQNYQNYTPVNYKSVPCFAAGTMIKTETGMRKIEKLSVGDRITTHDHGLQTIRWAGSVTLTCRDLIACPHLAPIVIERGALGPDMPKRTLRLSPQHRVLLHGWGLELALGVTEALAPAKFLLGQRGIHQDHNCPDITYCHILFDRHEIINSNGQWSESLLPGDMVHRDMKETQNDELRALLPKYIGNTAATSIVAARPSLRQHEVKVVSSLAA